MLQEENQSQSANSNGPQSGAIRPRWAVRYLRHLPLRRLWEVVLRSPRRRQSVASLRARAR